MTSDVNTIKRFTLRIDNKIFDIVKLIAKENKRSAAQEINFALEQYYRNKAQND